MKNQIKTSTVMTIAAGLLEAWALYVVGASPARWRPALIVRDEPEAHALYEAMNAALREAESLSYTSFCSGPDSRLCTYTVRQQKPNRFSLNVVNGMTSKSTTVLGDGNDVWTYWTGDRPYLSLDDDQSHEEAASDVYIRKAASAERSDAAREIARFGRTWYPLILDPDIFHGHADPFEPYIDGIRSRGRNDVDDEVCDVIEVSYMQAQRTRFYWLSREDHLPRRIKEVVRFADIRVTIEEWKDLAVNSEISSKTLAWSPPENWRHWSPPTPERFLPVGGREAPDFELHSVEKGTIHLSDYRGQVVWLYLWQVGTPSCREGLRSLQTLHDEYADKGLAILGLNFLDDRRIVRFFLKDNGVTFPNVLDASLTAERVVAGRYGNKTLDVPLNYIIDREGKLVDAWYGDDRQRAGDALNKAGRPIADRPGG